MNPICPTIEEAIKSSYGNAVTITGRLPVNGGSISSAHILVLSNHDKIFCKSHNKTHVAMFEAEIRGLEALRLANCIPVAKPLAIGCSDTESFILLELITPGQPKKDFWKDFGRRLALLHDSFSGRQFGFDLNNFIGSTVQLNTWDDSWVNFFAQQRLDFQTELAWESRLIPDSLYRNLKTLIRRLPDFMTEPQTVSLLHGDLWSGNYMTSPDGHAVLIDPAVYCGHHEAELAMTELFGGYPREFYDAYNEVKKIDPVYRRRKDLYNLYHMLNHVNLFGATYVQTCVDIVKQYV